MYLYKYTYLKWLWHTFQSIIALSPMDKDIGYSLVCANTYLESVEIPVSHTDFWNCMFYFLRRTNQNYRERQALNGK